MHPVIYSFSKKKGKNIEKIEKKTNVTLPPVKTLNS